MPEPRSLEPPVSTARLALFLMLALLAAACGGSGREAGQAGQEAGAAGAPAVGKLEVREPRALLTPGMGMGAAYFTVVNPGSEADRLLRVETAAARVAETHESVDEGGMMRMVARPEGFEVPAGGTLELQPGGKHVMLMETRPAADAAGRIPLTLVFERAGRIEVQASLVEAGGESGREAGGR